MSLQVRRGLSSQMTSAVTPDEAEPIFTLDNKKLFVGDGITTADNLVPINQDFATSDLSDVSAVSPTNDTFLKYNSSNTRYEPVAFSLAALPEVHSGPGTANQVLAVDGNVSNASFGKLLPTTLTVDFLSDVNITNIQNGDSLVYDSATSEFVNQAGGGGGSSTLASLTDVSISFVQGFDMLVYDSFTSSWLNQPFILEAIVSDGSLSNAANDSAAATAGVPIGALYRNGSVLQVRVT